MSEAELDMYKTQKEQVMAILSSLSEPDPAMEELVNSLDEMIALLEGYKKCSLSCKTARKQIEPTRTEKLTCPNYKGLNEETPAEGDEVDPFAVNVTNISEEATVETEDSEPHLPGPNVSSSVITKAEHDLHASLLHLQCRAPFQHSWGQKRYYNAMVQSVEERQESNDGEETDLRVRVLYLQPTHRRMVPCKFFLDGKCRFSEQHCHFSHGEVFGLEELEPYVPPDFSTLKSGSACLCMSDAEEGLWEHGTVVEITPTSETEGDELVITVRIDGSKYTRTMSITQLVPDPVSDKTAEQSEDEELNIDEETTVEEIQGARVEEPDKTFTPYSAWSQPTSVVQVDNSFAGWEAHTKGVGSKLMSQMGFVVGLGLGRNSGGRTEPVEAQVLPKGRSLDYCMALREQKDFPEVGKARRKTKPLKRLDVKTKTPNPVKNVFDVLNSHLGGGKVKKSTAKKISSSADADLPLRKTKTSRGSASSHARNLNVEALKVHDKIKSLEKELIGLRASHGRNLINDKGAASLLASKIKAKESELSALQRKEGVLSQMKTREKEKKAIGIF